MAATVPPADMRVCEMAFGKKKSDSGDEVTSAPGTDDDGPDGPFDIDDFDDASAATHLGIAAKLCDDAGARYWADRARREQAELGTG